MPQRTLEVATRLEVYILKQYRILVFGDSITWGAWDPEGGWVDRVKRYYSALRLESSDKKVQIFNLGIGGEKSAGLLARFDAEVQARTSSSWEFVFVFATGMNDSRAEDNTNNVLVSPAQYQANVSQITAKARAYSNKILWQGLTPVDESRMPLNTRLYWSNQRTAEYDQALSEQLASPGFVKVDTFGSLQAQSTINDWLASDGVHPSAEGHAFIYQLMLPEIEKLLN